MPKTFQSVPSSLAKPFEGYPGGRLEKHGSFLEPC